MEGFPPPGLLPSSLLPPPSNPGSLFFLFFFFFFCFFLRGFFRATGAFRAFPASACHRSHLLSLAFRSLFILERLGLVLKYRDLFFHLRYPADHPGDIRVHRAQGRGISEMEKK